MQQIKQQLIDDSVAKDTITQGNDILQQALSMFDMQLSQPVAMAFPNVINDTGTPGVDIGTLDVNQLFAQQEQLLYGAANLVPDNQTQVQTAPTSAPVQDTLDSSAELQAIQQMYANNER
ncbi:hypothetical protein ORJ04_03545 [Rheinheimera baltica]|uniref:Uncharacterized protein n=1 Tax=Rheinheimera baltica TaxID=67576 RepID=A0ABT9HV95_9GAMM|nr:hypothetical protein [Rheinheimera baltica]MDP5135021.1 hypothetical protein [Rheinheimera baltica]